MGRLVHVMLHLLCLCPLALLYAVAMAQETPGNDSGKTVLRTNVRAVEVDVVVTQKNGTPVKGLRERDFQVTEDGHPQTINRFEEHIVGGQPTDPQLPALPANIFTNIPRTRFADSVAVLLLDSLNTPIEEQAQVHKQILKYLDEMQSGERLAIFTLGSRLRYIQGFTDDPSILRQALIDVKRGSSPQASMLLQSRTENTAEQQAAASLEGGGAGSSGAAASLRSFLKEQSVSRDDTRAFITLDALRRIAYYLSGIPGRKNLIWFSSAFPTIIFAHPEANNQVDLGNNFSDEIKKTDAALAAAQVAIYPISAEGIAPDSLYGSDTQLAGVHSAYDAQEQSNRLIHEDANRRNADHATMDEIADDTGGKAIYNTNGLSDALARVVEHGSNYYTLFYSPTSMTENGQFRKIRIKLAKNDYKLAYRRGYYAGEAKSAEKPGIKPVGDPLQSSMIAGMPDSTQIPFAIRIQSEMSRVYEAKTEGSVAHVGDNPKWVGPFTRYGVDFVIAAAGLQLEPTADGMHRDKIEVALLMYDQEGKPLNWMMRQVDLAVDSAHYTEVQANGINLRFEIDAPKGTSSFRGGIYDWSSHVVGTLEVPLSRLANKEQK
jgi:VWFA-related protein